MTLLTLHISVATQVVRQIHVVVCSVVKPVLYQTIGKLRFVDAKFVFAGQFPLLAEIKGSLPAHPAVHVQEVFPDDGTDAPR